MQFNSTVVAECIHNQKIIRAPYVELTLNRVRVMELSEDDIFLDLVSKMVSIDKKTWELIKDRLIPSSFASVINGQEGSMHLAACSVMNTTRTYTKSESWTHNLT